MNSTYALPAEPGWQDTPEASKAREYMQRADWVQAVQILGQLAVEYPKVPSLESLLAETQLRLEIEKHNSRVRSRLRIPGRNFIIVVALVSVLVGLAWAGISFYTAFITPSIAAVEATQQQAELAGEAQRALAAGDYRRALPILVELAKLNPQHPAVESIAVARTAIWLEEQYALAQQQLASDQMSEAQATLLEIRASSPTYRDVNALLQKIERAQRLAGVLSDANEAMLARKWSAAAAALEEARNISPRESRDSIEADLFEVYLALGSQLVEQSEGRTADLQLAVDRFGRALALRPMEPRITLQRGWARRYLDGYEAFGNARWDDAIAALDSLYREQPGYLDGRAAKLLYDANMHSAARLMEDQKEALAWQRYYAASQLKGVDTTAAQALEAKLGRSIAATPLPAATPAPSVAAPALPVRAVTNPLVRSAPVQLAPPAPTSRPPIATATATATPALASFKGKIAFSSTRGGAAEIWVMESDGQNAFRPGNQAAVRAAYQDLVAKDWGSPDGQRVLAVGTVKGETQQQVFIVSAAGSQPVSSMWGTSYDPAWSPSGRWIAFVSNAMGNDEIFVVDADGSNLKRLTSNTWEWDKHPSWAPSGKQIVFWSNRDSGRGQIWLMNEDGSEPVNLSRNGFEERDPVWIK